MEWAEKFADWFRRGKEESETLLGIPWDVETEQEGEQKVIIASHPKIPFNIVVYVSEDFANLYIDAGISTDVMDATERMRIYKKLLHINTDLNLMKAGLVSDEDRVVAAVDLDLASLNREEFNDALTLLITGATRIVEELDLGEELAQSMLEKQVEMIVARLQSGESREDILNFLIHRVGLERENAEEFLDGIKKAMNSMEAEGENESAAKPVPEGMYR